MADTSPTSPPPSNLEAASARPPMLLRQDSPPSPTSTPSSRTQLPTSTSSAATVFPSSESSIRPSHLSVTSDRNVSHARNSSVPASQPASTLPNSQTSHLRSNSIALQHSSSPLQSRSGSFASGTAGSSSNALGALGIPGTGYYAPRLRTTTGPSSFADDQEGGSAPGTSPATGGYIFDSSYYNQFWTGNGTPGAPMTPSTSSNATDSRRGSRQIPFSSSPAMLGAYSASMRHQNSASTRASGASAFALGLSRASVSSGQSSPRSSLFPHMGEGMEGAFSPPLPYENGPRSETSEQFSAATVSPNPSQDSHPTLGRSKRSSRRSRRKKSPTTSRATMQVPVIPRRDSSHHSSTSSLRRPSTDDTPLGSTPGHGVPMMPSLPSGTRTLSSDSSDYGSQADADELTRSGEQGSEEVDENEEDYLLDSGMSEALRLATSPPKLQRPHRTRVGGGDSSSSGGGVHDAEPNATAGASNDSPQGIGSMMDILTSPTQSAGSQDSMSASLQLPQASLSPRKPRLDPALGRQRSFSRLAAASSSSANSPQVRNRELPESQMVKKEPDAEGDITLQNEAELEAAALRQADEEDPDRPRTLKEARELAKARAKARREGSMLAETLIHKAGPTIASDAAASPKARQPPSLPIPASQSSDLTKRYGTISPKASSEAQTDNDTSDTVFQTQSSTMDELQAAVGDAIEDIDFSMGGTANDSFSTVQQSGLSRQLARSNNTESTHIDGQIGLGLLRTSNYSDDQAELSNRSSGEVSFNSAREPDDASPFTRPREIPFDAASAAAGDRTLSGMTADSDLATEGFEGGRTPSAAPLASFSSPLRGDDESRSVAQSNSRATLRRRPSATDQESAREAPTTSEDGHLSRGGLSLAQALSISGPPSPLESNQPLPAEHGKLVPAHIPLTAAIAKGSIGKSGLMGAGTMTASGMIGIPGKTIPFPKAFKASLIAVEKRRLPPWERARAYAAFTNELAATPSGLALWMEGARRGLTHGSSTGVKSVGRGYPGNTPTGLVGVSDGATIHPRDVSGASVRSDQTFPVRGDGGKAREITQIALDSSEPDAMPGALPASIPYPSLVHQPSRSLSNASGQASENLANQHAGQKASPGGPTLAERAGLRARKLSNHALDSFGSLSSFSGASTLAQSQSTQGRLPGSASRNGISGATAGTQSPGPLPTSGSQTSNRPSLFSSLGRRGSKRTPHPGAPSPMSQSSSSGNNSFGSVSGPRAPRLPGATGALGRAMGYNQRSIPTRGSSSNNVAAPGTLSAQDATAGYEETVKDSETVRHGLSSPSAINVELQDASDATTTLMPSSSVSGPRGPRQREKLRSKASISNITVPAGKFRGSGDATSPTYVPAYPGPNGPSAKRTDTSPSLSPKPPTVPTDHGNDIYAGAAGGATGGLLSSLRSNARKNSWNSGASGEDASNERPGFKEALRKLSDVLPDADEDVLEGYLRRAGGNDLRAIGDYLGDQAKGSLKAPTRR